jgi:transmembrane sensor
MDDLSDRFQRLGEAVGGASERAADRAVLDVARRRWMAFQEPSNTTRRRGRPLLLAIAAALCIGAIVVLSSWSSRAAVSFELGSPPVRGEVGEWVAASSAAPLGVRFSEGTLLTLDPGARMRVTKTSPRGADVLIERGKLHAAVVHTGSDSRWALHAGPFDVRVTGTSFDASWDPDTETFDLLMKDGSVNVSGPLLPHGRAFRAGEHMMISVRDARMELKTASAEPVAPDLTPTALPLTPNPVTPKGEGGEDIGKAAPPVSPREEKGGPRAPTWQELSAAGKHRDALAAVEQRGFEQEIGHASAAELLALADTARFAGRPGRAREALLALRKRFGAKGHSAFLLGKIAADQQGAGAEAATWFDISLAEEPNGALAEQALGRLLEIKKRRDPEAARSLAARYLQKYPRGAYAALARSLGDVGGKAPP